MSGEQASKLWGYLENIQNMLKQLVENKRNSGEHNEIEDAPQDEPTVI